MAYGGTGQLDPNQAAPGTAPSDTSAPENPTEQENELCKQIERLFTKAARHRKRYDKTWVDNYKFYRGQQLGGRRPSYKNREVINMIFRVIQGQTSVMLDARPMVGFLPQNPADLEFASILEEVFNADWDRNDWMMELAEIVLDGHLYSVGFGECCYDENLAGGRAGIKWRSKDPMDLYPDPDATDVNKEGEYIIDAKPWDVDKIKKKYAGHKYVTQIKPDLTDMSYDKKQVATLHIQRNTDLDLPPDKLVYAQSPEEDSKDKVLVITAYLKPSDTEEVEQDDKNGGDDKLYITRLKYPRGRKVVKIGKYIFEDGPLEYDDLEFPFHRYVNSVLSREFYGIDELENLKGPQMVFNKMVNFALDVLMLMGNPVWMNPIESGVDSRLLTNEPGLVVEHNRDAPPSRAEGVQLQPWVFQLIDRMEKWFNDTAGDQDVTRGINPTGVTANAAIENLLDAAQKRVKQKIRNLDNMMRAFGRQWVSRCMQFYTAPQIFRLTDKEGVDKYFKFHIDERDALDAEGLPYKAKFAVKRDFYKNDFGQMVPEDTANEYEIRGELDVRVNTISGLPFSKAENESKVFNLFDRQIIDAQEVLKRLEYPNADQILQRMKQAQAAAAEAQPPAK